MVIYFLVSKVVIGIETGQTTGIGVGLIFLYFFGNAARGAFVFHRIEKVDNPNYQPTSKLVYWIGVPLAAIFVVMIGFGVMTMTGLAPPTDVQSGSSLLPAYRAELISNDIVYEDDEIVYFYSYGLSSILEGGSVLTDDRVIMYFTNHDGELEVYELYLFDISSVELVSSGNMFNDSIYKVNSFEPDAWLQISLPTEKRGDVLFVEELRLRIQP